MRCRKVPPYEVRKRLRDKTLAVGLRQRLYTIVAMDKQGNEVFSATYRATSVSEAKAMCERECAGNMDAETFRHLR